VSLNVYDMDIEGFAEPAWVRFHTQHNLITLMHPDQEPAFFATHPRIEVDRNTDFTPRESDARFGDYSNLNHNVHPVFSQRAKDLLTPHLQGLGQWIELVSDEAPYWLFFISHVVDALDVPNSKILYFPSTPGKVMRIARYAFHPDAVRDQWLFTLPQMVRSHRLVTDRFVDFVRAHGLTGFEFRLLWSEEQGPVPDDMKNWERPRMAGLDEPDPRPLSIFGSSRRNPDGSVIPAPS
jgi:hypothetical protein